MPLKWRLFKDIEQILTSISGNTVYFNVSDKRKVIFFRCKKLWRSLLLRCCCFLVYHLRAKSGLCLIESCTEWFWKTTKQSLCHWWEFDSSRVTIFSVTDHPKYQNMADSQDPKPSTSSGSVTTVSTASPGPSAHSGRVNSYFWYVKYWGKVIFTVRFRISLVRLWK